MAHQTLPAVRVKNSITAPSENFDSSASIGFKGIKKAMSKRISSKANLHD
jgi:hypothetical protein